MNIERSYNYIKRSELPKRQSIFKRIKCKHELLDDVLIGESGFSRISGEEHIVYCKKCGHIEGCYSEEYK